MIPASSKYGLVVGLSGYISLKIQRNVKEWFVLRVPFSREVFQVILMNDNFSKK